MKHLEGYTLVRANSTPGAVGDEQLVIVLVPKRTMSTSPGNIANAVEHFIRREHARFTGKSVRITVEDLQVCRSCGCTEDNACDGGCSWITPDLCSACTGDE